METVKFRAWFVESKIMYSWDDLINKIGLSESVFTETKLWKPMQFTGLLDPTDTEIYEGDILRQQNVFNGDIYVGAVKAQEDGRWAIDLGDHVPSVTPLFCEVIGNIYQNPELLEIKNDTNE